MRNEFFEKAKETAKNLGSRAVDEASDLAEIGKYKTKIASQKSVIKDTRLQIGKYVYQKFKDSDEEEEIKDPQLLELCQTIDSAYDEITILEDKIERIKKDKK